MIRRGVESFTVGSKLIGALQELRLDASFYNRSVMHALAELEACGIETRPLGEVTELVFMPTRFKRTYVAASHGIPFLQGSHVVQLRPADVKYLSKAAHGDLSPYLIRHGWILLTRSGTTGRVALVPREWDGWAASEHIFRIVPKQSGYCPAGYLATFLASPLGQAQLSAQVYGAVVDELTEEQVRGIHVPIPGTRTQKRHAAKVHELAMEALELRAEAVACTEQAAHSLASFLPQAPLEVPDDLGVAATGI
jgi:Type I restriction modification DNA specificity domain